MIRLSIYYNKDEAELYQGLSLATQYFNLSDKCSLQFAPEQIKNRTWLNLQVTKDLVTGNISNTCVYPENKYEHKTLKDLLKYKKLPESFTLMNWSSKQKSLIKELGYNNILQDKDQILFIGNEASDYMRFNKRILNYVSPDRLEYQYKASSLIHDEITREIRAVLPCPTKAKLSEVSCVKVVEVSYEVKRKIVESLMETFTIPISVKPPPSSINDAAYIAWNKKTQNVWVCKNYSNQKEVSLEELLDYYEIKLDSKEEEYKLPTQGHIYTCGLSVESKKKIVEILQKTFNIFDKVPKMSLIVDSEVISWDGTSGRISFEFFGAYVKEVEFTEFFNIPNFESDEQDSKRTLSNGATRVARARNPICFRGCRGIFTANTKKLQKRVRQAGVQFRQRSS